MSYAPTYVVSQADTLPPYTATLTNNNAPVNLTTATSVTFIMANYFSGVVATGAATVVSAVAGKVSYAWGSNDLSTPGIYSIQWQVVFPSGTITYPASGYNHVTVFNNLAIGYPNVSTVFNTIHSGTAAPTSVQGNNGDYWFNSTIAYFYGPKVNGTWPAGFPISASGSPLNSMAAPTGPVNMGNQKMVSLANGSVSTDAAAFGQLPLADSAAVNINPLGIQGAGANGLWADSGHVHPFSSNVLVTPVTVTGTTAATLLLAGPTLAIGTARAGMIFEFCLWGTVSTTVDTQTISFSVKWGGVAGTGLLTVGPSTPNASATVTNAVWRFSGSIALPTSTSTSAAGQSDINFFPVSVNTGTASITNTVSKQLVLAVTNSANAVSVTANGGWFNQVG